jgi:hypothetical protein
MSAPTLLLLLHAGTTLALVGLIWTVQIVQYPLFATVPDEGFRAFHRGHMRRITWIVGPLMLIEAASAGLLLANALVAPSDASSSGVPLPLLVGTALIPAIWIVTFAISVPCHSRLERGFDPTTHRRLVRTNWLRTAGWTIRGLLALWLLAPAVPG